MEGPLSFQVQLGHRSINGLCLTLLCECNKTSDQTNTFSLSGSLTTKIFNQKVKALEGLISFTNTIGLRSTGASSTWRGREREIGEKK